MEPKFIERMRSEYQKTAMIYGDLKALADCIERYGLKAWSDYVYDGPVGREETTNAPEPRREERESPKASSNVACFQSFKGSRTARDAEV